MSRGPIAGVCVDKRVNLVRLVTITSSTSVTLMDNIGIPAHLVTIIHE